MSSKTYVGVTAFPRYVEDITRDREIILESK
jgi:hypothetical protein